MNLLWYSQQVILLAWLSAVSLCSLEYRVGQQSRSKGEANSRPAGPHRLWREVTHACNVTSCASNHDLYHFPRNTNGLLKRRRRKRRRGGRERERESKNPELGLSLSSLKLSLDTVSHYRVFLHFRLGVWNFSFQTNTWSGFPFLSCLHSNPAVFSDASLLPQPTGILSGLGVVWG